MVKIKLFETVMHPVFQDQQGIAHNAIRVKDGRQ
jgi:hypothetical protein